MKHFAIQIKDTAEIIGVLKANTEAGTRVSILDTKTITKMLNDHLGEDFEYFNIVIFPHQATGQIEVIMENEWEYEYELILTQVEIY